MANNVKDEVLRLFDLGELTLQEIATLAGTTYKVVWATVAKNRTIEVRKSCKVAHYRRSKLGDRNPMQGRIGMLHPNYKGEVGDGNGYIMVLKPAWYTGRKGSKHVFKHTIVMCEALGLDHLPKGFVVHHIDHNPKNNDINNLCLMTNEAHLRLHQRERATTIREE